MSKKHTNEGIGPDNWLHILSHVVALYANEGGLVAVRYGSNRVIIELAGVVSDDWRLHPDLLAFLSQSGGENQAVMHERGPRPNSEG